MLVANFCFLCLGFTDLRKHCRIPQCTSKHHEHISVTKSCFLSYKMLYWYLGYLEIFEMLDSNNFHAFCLSNFHFNMSMNITKNLKNRPAVLIFLSWFSCSTSQSCMLTSKKIQNFPRVVGAIFFQGAILRWAPILESVGKNVYWLKCTHKVYPFQS